MEYELKYLQDKIEELEWDISCYTSQVWITESERQLDIINGFIERKLTELEMLQSIMDVVSKH